MTREGTGDLAGHSMIVTGDINFHKFGTGNTNVSFYWEDHFIANTTTNEFTVDKVISEYYSAGLSDTGAQVTGGNWYVTPAGGAELSITNLTVSVT